MRIKENKIKTMYLLICMVLAMAACQTKKEKLGESDEINQTPSLPEARKPLPDTVRLELKDFVFLPPKVILPPSEEVFFILTNNGEKNHRIFFEFPYGNVEMEMPIAPGTTDSVAVKIPDQAGTYKFYCPEADGQHHANGMQGDIIVKEESI